ncbi:MAG: hypothetical protein ACP5QO_12065 [Clostridia bacterium]
MRWRHERRPCWRLRAAVNGLGALVTGVATLVYIATKFPEGAYIVIIAVTTALGPEADETEERQTKAWEPWSESAKLMVLKTQYQSVVRPILRFVNSIERHTSARVPVLIPEIVPNRLEETILHNQTGSMLAKPCGGAPT